MKLARQLFAATVATVVMTTGAMAQDLTGRHAVITGGANGLGRAIARKTSAVVLIGRTADRLERAIRAHGSRASR